MQVRFSSRSPRRARRGRARAGAPGAPRTRGTDEAKLVTRIAASWSMAVRACAALFEPRIDVSASDREVEALVAASWIGGASESLVSKLRAAWLDSRCRALLRAVVGGV